MEVVEYFKAALRPAPCGVDISNGSERALYVPMDHVFKILQRPHRAVNLMFTYYPFDKGWPKRASQIVKWKEGMGQWDLPFDDYEVYRGGPGGIENAEVFRQCKDVRSFGQDIHLTLTIDLKVPSKTLRQIARDLRPYGRVFFRINHECNGTWFQHNRRYTYKQVNNFFVKFHHIVKEESPLVKTVFCLNGCDDPKLLHIEEKELAGAVRTADVLAVDRYLSLHFAWPNKFVKSSGSYFDLDLQHWWNVMEENYRCLCDTRGNNDFPFTLPELNADSEVNGFAGQAHRIMNAYELIKTRGKAWVNAVTMYQFRDRGGLGLELEDPHTNELIKRLPSCYAYRKTVSDPYFMPVVKTKGRLNTARIPLTLKWFSSENAEGITLCGRRPPESKKCLLQLPDGNFLVQCNGKWFHSRGKKIDLKKIIDPATTFNLHIFAPPEYGVNSQAADGSFLPYFQKTIHELPRLIW